MPMMVCVKCGSFLKIKKNGVSIEELMPSHIPGEWQPYKLWMADLYGCERCGAEVAAGFGQQPFAEHYQDAYAKALAGFPPLVQVDDCPGSFRP